MSAIEYDPKRHVLHIAGTPLVASDWIEDTRSFGLGLGSWEGDYEDGFVWTSPALTCDRTEEWFFTRALLMSSYAGDRVQYGTVIINVGDKDVARFPAQEVFNRSRELLPPIHLPGLLRMHIRIEVGSADMRPGGESAQLFLSGWHRRGSKSSEL